MNRLAALLITPMVTAALLLGTASIANAAEPPPITKKYARMMDCKWPEKVSVAGGGRNLGVECVIRKRTARVEMYVLKYRNIERAVDFWRDWTSNEYGGERGCIARKGRVLAVVQSPDPYSCKWSQYAANRIDGRLIRGYRYQ